MPFLQDLAFGEQYQHKLLELIAFDTCEIAKGNFKPWDVKIIYENDTTTFEVKVDRKAKNSGNIAIEYECNGKPSGISTTEADFWAYFIYGTNEYFLIPTEDIRNAILNKKYWRTAKGGDGYRANLYLFPFPVFEDFRELYEN